MIINKSKNKLACTSYRFLCALTCVMVFLGCATVPRETNVIASVDGEAITVEDLIYSLNLSHRVEDLSSAGQMDMSAFVQQMIGELLIVQEAQRMGMADQPEIKKKVDAFILRESVTLLYKEEVLDKVHVSETEIRELYKRNYERFTMGIIASASQEDAAGILERLKAGEDFQQLAQEHSIDYSRDGGEKTHKRKELVPVLEKVLLDLKDGEISGVINIDDKFFYIVKLIKRQEAAEDEYEKAAKGIKRYLNKLKTKKRSDEYLAELRAGMNVQVDREVLRSLELDKKESRQKRLQDKRVLVKVNDSVLTAGELVPAKIDKMEKVLNNWIDIKVVDYEALGRRYDLKSDFKGNLRRYERQLLRRKFANKIIVPRISISSKEIEDYYIKHKDDFAKPLKYKIQQITVETEKEALDVIKSLDGGASFAWLAKRISKDSVASKGGAAGWKIKNEFKAAAAEIIDALNPGEITPVMEVDGYFRVIRLQEKSEPEFEVFDKVKQTIQKKVLSDKYDELLNEYVDRLKKTSNVYIDKEAIESYKAQFRK